ncbi:MULTISPECIES: hypothetical protein [unclassified Gordonia (in: high G+C Gram-positive bacteria)]|jgi:hypothetical protein|uniref:hypothetical protein n=1 Tax=Gordonia TaxID=2053 RepID=UPI000990A054|nr:MULTISPECIES: hypothetical protein [unclassified Gordonia (in: high G+C Gram-positive bacteria)]MBN0973119.1 hypothetical protein [Gordonia sp. BP-119]MBN0983152.1 hypothetical protein [Gordonia sp. BP-94]MBR7194226.1 hypothetical protein [Gordonia sp. SCSIO 19800]
MGVHRFERLTAVLAACAAGSGVLAGCAPAAPHDRDPMPSPPASTSAPPPSTKIVTAGPQRDEGPVIRRFPLLQGSVIEGWTAGTLGGNSSDRVPGPSTYWFDAVVHVGTDRAAAWAGQYDADPVAPPDSVAGALRDLVPPGGFVGGPALDRAFSSPEWRATVYLSLTTGRVVVLGIDD